MLSNKNDFSRKLEQTIFHSLNVRYVVLFCFSRNKLKKRPVPGHRPRFYPEGQRPCVWSEGFDVRSGHPSVSTLRPYDNGLSPTTVSRLTGPSGGAVPSLARLRSPPGPLSQFRGRVDRDPDTDHDQSVKEGKGSSRRPPKVTSGRDRVELGIWTTVGRRTQFDSPIVRRVNLRDPIVDLNLNTLQKWSIITLDHLL